MDHPRTPALRILLAEDDAFSQRVALQLLEALGLLADVVADGEEALAAALAHAYDVILMDIEMPGMDGLAVTRALREVRPGPRPYIIAVTASATRRLCVAAGMDDFVAKPIDAALLTAALGRGGVTAGSRVGVDDEESRRAGVGAAATSDDAALLAAEIVELRGLLAVLASDDAEVEAELRGILIDSLGRAAELPALVAGGDRRAIRFAAHALTGTAGTAGLSRLAEATRALEFAAAATPLEALAERARRVCAWIDALIAALTAGPA